MGSSLVSTLSNNTWISGDVIGISEVVIIIIPQRYLDELNYVHYLQLCSTTVPKYGVVLCISAALENVRDRIRVEPRNPDWPERADQTTIFDPPSRHEHPFSPILNTWDQ